MRYIHGHVPITVQQQHHSRSATFLCTTTTHQPSFPLATLIQVGREVASPRTQSHTQQTSLHHPWEALKTRTTAPEHNQLNRVSLQSHRPHVAKGAHLTQAQPRHSAPSKKSGVRDTHTHTHTSLWFISQTPTHTHPRNDPSLFSWNHRCRQFLMYSPRLSSQPCFTTEESSAMLMTGPPP